MAGKDKPQSNDVRNSLEPLIDLVIDAIINLEVAGTVKQADAFGMFSHLSDPQYEFVMGFIPESLGGSAQGPEREEIWREMVKRQRSTSDFQDEVGRLRMRIAMLESGESETDVDARIQWTEPGPSRLREMLNEMHESMQRWDED